MREHLHEGLAPEVLARKAKKLLGRYRSHGATPEAQARLDYLDLRIFETHGIGAFKHQRGPHAKETDAA